MCVNGFEPTNEYPDRALMSICFFCNLAPAKVYETKVMQCNTVYSPATTVKSVKSSSSSLKVSVKFVGPLKSKKAFIIDALGSATTRRGAYELT